MDGEQIARTAGRGLDLLPDVLDVGIDGPLVGLDGHSVHRVQELPAGEDPAGLSDQRDQQLRFRGNCDPLTGMMNRGRMAEALGEIMAASRREERSCAFLIATIANLSMVNDAYGFDIADEVIIALGRRLRQVVRTGDAIGRYSGAKFGIILSNCNESELKAAAERFLSIARESVIETDVGPVWAMLSICGLVLPKFAGTANLAMARAEEALAEAKRMPSDGFVSYRPSPERISVRSVNAQCAAEIVSGLKEVATGPGAAGSGPCPNEASLPKAGLP